MILDPCKNTKYARWKNILLKTLRHYEHSTRMVQFPLMASVNLNSARATHFLSSFVSTSSSCYYSHIMQFVSYTDLLNFNITVILCIIFHLCSNYWQEKPFFFLQANFLKTGFTERWNSGFYSLIPGLPSNLTFDLSAARTQVQLLCAHFLFVLFLKLDSQKCVHFLHSLYGGAIGRRQSDTLHKSVNRTTTQSQPSNLWFLLCGNSAFIPNAVDILKSTK